MTKEGAASQRVKEYGRWTPGDACPGARHSRSEVDTFPGESSRFNIIYPVTKVSSILATPRSSCCRAICARTMG